MTSWITICETCKRDDWDETQGDTDGARLADLVEQALPDGVRLRKVACLMGCSRSCNVAVQAKGKIAYTLGELEPTAEDAAALAEFARLHGHSETGQVPYRSWPEGVKGHFVTRHFPLPE